MRRILLTNDWVSDLDGVIGSIEFNDSSARANFIYEMLLMKPEEFRFEIGFTNNPDGSKTLTEVSLVGKYGKRHPMIIKRRLADKVRTTWRRLKQPKPKLIT